MDMKILLKCVHIGNMASSMALTTKSNWCEWQRNIQNILVRKLSSLIIYAYTNLFILHRAGILPPIPKEIDFTNPPHVHVCMHRTSILSSLPHILPNIVNKLVYIAYFIVLWIAVLFSRLSFPCERYALDKISYTIRFSFTDFTFQMKCKYETTHSQPLVPAVMHCFSGYPPKSDGIAGMTSIYFPVSEKCNLSQMWKWMRSEWRE